MIHYAIFIVNCTSKQTKLNKIGKNEKIKLFCTEQSTCVC